MDEYDDYAYGIRTILRGGANSEALADHLETLRAETMGCPPDRQRDELIAAELLKRWRHLKGEAVYSNNVLQLPVTVLSALTRGPLSARS
jgi:hypothetical protein